MRKLAGFNLLQLNYWPWVIVCVGFGWFGRQQQTRRKPNTCSLLQGCELESSCSQIFFISMLNLGIAYGAKVGPKLRIVCHCKRG